MIMSDPNYLKREILKQEALKLLDDGFSVLPAIRNGSEKRPAVGTWKRYRDALPTRQEIQGWFQDGDVSALCIVCGKVSGNFEVIDFDLEGEFFSAWEQAVEERAPGLIERVVIESTPSGGFHVMYRCAEPVGGNQKLAQRRLVFDSDDAVEIGGKWYEPRPNDDGTWDITVTAIETRGEGGICLCAPSPGYDLIQSSFRDLVAISSDERDILLGCAWALDEVTREVVNGIGEHPPRASGCLRPGDDFNARGNPRGVLLQHGWQIEKSGENEHWRRPGKDRGTSATLRDGVFYNFSSNAPPFQEQRAYSPFAVYALLNHGGDFSAAASDLAGQGYGSEPENTTSRPQAENADGGLVQPGPRSAIELVQGHRELRPPVIHGLLREGETMNLIAASKTGKSWLATDLAWAIAKGQPWLDRFATEPGHVLILDNELHPETSAYRVSQVARCRGIAIEEHGDRVHVENLRGRLMDMSRIGSYFRAIEPGRYKVIILDAFYRFIPTDGDENSNALMAQIYNMLDGIAGVIGCCFVLIHHSSKGDQSGKAVTDVGAGAGAQSRATDTHVILRPHPEEDVVILDAAVRSWPPVESICLGWEFPVWSVEVGVQPPNVTAGRYRGRRSKRHIKKQAAPEWTVEEFVDQFLDQDPKTAGELRETASRVDGLSKRKVGDLLATAESSGLVERVTLPGRGGPQAFKRSETEVSK